MAGQKKTKNGLTLLASESGKERLLQLAEQGMSIDGIAAEMQIPRGSINKWLDAAENSALFARARTRAADALATETLEIADNVEEDPVAIQKAKLRSDNRKWIAAKWDAARYGDQKQGVNVNISLGELHLRAVKTVKPSQEPDTLTIEADVAPRSAGVEGQ